MEKHQKIATVRKSLEAKLDEGRRTKKDLSTTRQKLRLKEQELEIANRINDHPIIQRHVDVMVDELARSVVREALERAHLERYMRPESGNYVLHMRVPETHRSFEVSRIDLECLR